MAEQEWTWVEMADALCAHQWGIAMAGGSNGIHDAGLLESALARPKNLAAYGDPGLADLATGYLFAITENHPFVDGNKRAAWMIMRFFIKSNGGTLAFNVSDAIELGKGVADGTIDQNGARNWILKRLI